MATYVVGDVQGCFLTFQKLLLEIEFDETRDKLILLGDAVNRGPHSLSMLRFLKTHHSSMEMVLGNHDILTIALAHNATKAHRSHALDEVLSAPDKFDLIDYLCAQPLLRTLGNNIFVHAGILPCVTIDEAISSAHELNQILRSDKAIKFLARYYEKTPVLMKRDAGQSRALRMALAYFTLLRMCKSEVLMDLSYSGTLEKAPKHLKPWFFLRNDPDHIIYFGHWAALGFYQYRGYICLDSGCCWGNKLTALRLSDQKVFQVANIDPV